MSRYFVDRNGVKLNDNWPKNKGSLSSFPLLLIVGVLACLFANLAFSTGASVVEGSLVAKGILPAEGSLLAAQGIAEDGFHRPPHVAKAVDFWTRVYSEIDTQTGFIHDSKFLDVVYELYPLNYGDNPRKQQKNISKRIAEYRSLVMSSAGKPLASLSAEEKRIYQLLDGKVSTDELKMAAKRIRFQRGQSDRFIKGLKREDQIGQGIREIINNAGLPEQIAAIPHVESSYNAKVKSHAGALGLWQLMPATARRYIKVNRKVDERLNVEKATLAAVQLLKHNYSVLESWPLAITAYNRGLAGVRRAVRETGSRDIGVITREYQGRSFGFASRNFYAAFLAAVDVSRRNRNLPSIHDPLYGLRGQVKVSLQNFLPAFVLSDELGLDELAVRHLNPGLSARVWNGEKLIPAGYPLVLPELPGNIDVQQAIRTLEGVHGVATQLPDRFYRIQRGDNIVLLAGSLGTDLKQLMAMNKVKKGKPLYAGQLLRLPLIDEVDTKIVPQYADFRPLEYRRLKAKLNRHNGSSDISKGVMVYGIMRDNRLERELRDYIEEAVGVSQTSLLDVRIAANIPSAALLLQEFATGLGSDDRMFAMNEPLESIELLEADPADYLVDRTNRIEIQADETIGHYADWLGVSSKELRKLNKLGKRQHLVVGKKLALSFAKIDRSTFEQRGKEYHASMQGRFFDRFQIAGVREHALVEGDNLWELANDDYQIPLWLLRQYNPDINFGTVLPLDYQLRIPLVTASS